MKYLYLYLNNFSEVFYLTLVTTTLFPCTPVHIPSHRAGKNDINTPVASALRKRTMNEWVNSLFLLEKNGSTSAGLKLTGRQKHTNKHKLQVIQWELCCDYNCNSTAIRLRGITCAFHSTRAKNEHVSFPRSRIVFISQSNRTHHMP